MAVRSERLAAVRLASGATNVPLYTCPAGKTALVKYVTLYQNGGTPTPASLSILPAGGQRTTVYGEVLQPNISAHLDAFLVLHPGDVLEGHNAATGVSLHVTASGAELLGVSP